MAGKSARVGIDEILDSLMVEDMERQQPVEPGAGWEAMSEDEKRFEARKRELLIREKDEKIRQLKDTHELRRKYLACSFLFVAMFSMSSISILVQCGVDGLALSDAVLITLISTTMANVIGVLGIAFNWLFPKNSAATTA